MPRVSVITCVYNLEDIVLETVYSVLNQTYRDIELIIVDDGSTDRTLERLETVRDPRFKIVRALHSGLPSVGFTRALQAAVPGEFIAVTGSDDVWLPNRLETQIKFLDLEQDVGMVHSDAHLLIDGTTVRRPSLGIPPGRMSPREALRRLLQGNFICTPTMLLRTSTLSKTAGLYNTDTQLCGPEDFDHWLRLAEAGIAFGYIDEPLIRYRVRPDSVSRNRARSLNGDIVALNLALRRSPQIYADYGHLVRRRLAYLHRELAGCKFLDGTPGAWSNWRHAVAYSPLNLKTWSWGFLGLMGARSAEHLLELRRSWKARLGGSTPTTSNTLQEVGDL